MHVRNFYADTLDEALKEIKRELGPDAIILKTRTNKGLIGQIKKKKIEITAAISEKNYGKKRVVDTILDTDQKERLYKGPSSNNAIVPYMNKEVNTTKALASIELSFRKFMNKQVRKDDIALFYEITSKPAPNTINEVPIHFLIPAFIISELKTAFQIGFLLYIPFLILDMVIASVLMAMGMMMLPPVVVSLPFKLLLFVLVDGWRLITGSILRSFG